MAAMKRLALLLLALVQSSCGTMEDHRALYRPDPLGGYGGSQYMAETGTAGFRAMPPSHPPTAPEEPTSAARPEFRY